MAVLCVEKHNINTKCMHALLEILGLQLSFATKIQLHATHATTNLCSCLKQVAHDI